MLSCSNCGASLKLNAKLCIKCGHVVTDEEREAAASGIPIQKSIAVPEAIVQELAISEPVMIEEKKQATELPLDPVLKADTADTQDIKTVNVEKLESSTVLETPPSSVPEVTPQYEKDDDAGESKSDSSTPSAPSQVQKNLSVEDKTNNPYSPPTKSSSKLIGLSLAGVVIIGIGVFLYMGVNTADKAPMISKPLVDPAPSAVATAPENEAQPTAAPAPATVSAPQQTAEPFIAQPVKPVAAQPTQKPKPSSQQSEVPASMPDLNKLVKDAINK